MPVMNQPTNLNQATHCFNCGRCYCGIARTQTADNKTICVACKPSYDANLKAIKKDNP